METNPLRAEKNTTRVTQYCNTLPTYKFEAKAANAPLPPARDVFCEELFSWARQLIVVLRAATATNS